MSCTHAVILIRRDTASGGSKYPMFLQEVLFKPLLRWTSDALYASGGRSVCVVREDASLDELILPCFSSLLTDIVMLDAGASELDQDILTYLSGSREEALFVTAPVLLTGRAVESLCLARERGGNLLTELLTDDEQPTGAYCFSCADRNEIFSYLTGRFDFQAAYHKMEADKRPLGTFFVSDGSGGAARVQTPMELHMARRALQAAVVERHMRQGVAVLDPSSAIISTDAVIGRDTTLLPGVMILGETVIGEDCEIGPFTLLSDCIIGDRCTINASQVYSSQMGSEIKIGPYAYIRPNCTLGSRVKIGDFVELKNSHIGNGAKIPHLSYVGDTDMGEGVNIGCGSVTVNFDGHAKHRTTIEDGAFIGCQTNLVAPVTVGKNAFTAAGSTLTDDVPAGALAIARARQVNKEGWREERNTKRGIRNAELRDG